MSIFKTMVINLFTMNKKIKCAIILLVATTFSPNVADAQHYYANDETGELEFINDTQYVISFYSLANLIFYDTGYYTKENDTVFLTSNKQFRYSISSEFDTSELKDYEHFSFLLKCFVNWPEGKIRKFERIEMKGFRNKEKDIIYAGPTVYIGEVLVVFDNWIYRRFKVSKEFIRDYTPWQRTVSNYWLIIERDKEDRIYLDHFPLLIRKGKLIPIDKEMVYSCYLLNGFVFPTMDTKPRQLRKRCVLYRGNSDSADLLFPEEITIPQ